MDFFAPTSWPESEQALTGLRAPRGISSRERRRLSEYQREIIRPWASLRPSPPSCQTIAYPSWSAFNPEAAGKRRRRYTAEDIWESRENDVLFNLQHEQALCAAQGEEATLVNGAEEEKEGAAEGIACPGHRNLGLRTDPKVEEEEFRKVMAENVRGAGVRLRRKLNKDSTAGEGEFKFPKVTIRAPETSSLLAQDFAKRGIREKQKLAECDSQEAPTPPNANEVLAKLLGLSHISASMLPQAFSPGSEDSAF